MMHMSSPWRRLITPTLVDKLKKAKTAIAVARVLEGQLQPRAPEYTGSSSHDLTKHRIAEIERSYDPEWPDMEDVVWLGSHHAREVANRAEGYAQNWGWNCQHGGWRNQPSAVRAMVIGLRDRIDPALHAAQREFDPSRHLLRQYNDLESKVMARIEDIERKYTHDSVEVSPYLRRKLRQQEALELQEVLDDIAKGVRSWADNYPEHRNALTT